jgi:hypothetical protein
MTSAWVTLVMLDDSYVAGAITLAKSLRNVKTKYPIICMYADISDEAIRTLSIHFDKIIEVPLIECDISRKISEKAAKMYKWGKYSLTACNILNPEYGLDNVILINADVLIRRNIDSLMDIKEPAAMFSSPWSDDIYRSSHIKNHYGKLKHLDRVTRDMLRQSIVDGFALTGNIYVMQPNEASWKHFQLLSSGNVFGSEYCYASGSEQMFATIMHDLYDTLCPNGPVNIGSKYCCNVSKPCWIYPNAKITSAYAYHFGGCHPWESRHQKTKYSDVSEWLQVYKQANSQVTNLYK